MVTLTLRHREGPLLPQVRRLVRSFAALRKSDLWSSRAKGGVWFLEVKRSRDGLAWHPHMHVLVHGRFMSQVQLSDEWRKVTGDSYIVDVRIVDSVAEATRYVTKYVSKPVDASVGQNHDWHVEYLRDLRSVRMLGTFGSWRGESILGGRDDPEDWVPMGSLWYLIHKRGGGCDYARHILDQVERGSARGGMPPYRLEVLPAGP
jgi:hypothetical protein